ncbi:uncharacterized protein LOC106161441 [Lingula anatina]|uniref:Uncharacterized protein LOC106161441 n=1 Tax=Lingula anatina TaxID=7574 RepID=A0A1S3I7M0_LINAN|nr:uncharacterized protein LOC106161441 [Lingula anatina]|eukprot:XP_013393851.1 uncharacterized protein LOC106161441 [Lingula anatina]
MDATWTGTDSDVSITWKVPDDASVHGLNGFYVDIGGVYCAYFNLTTAVWTKDTTKIVFQHTVRITHGMAPFGNTVIIDVCSLPRRTTEPYNCEMKHMQLTSSTPSATTAPADWTTEISIRTLQCKEQVLVSFQLAPEEFNFSKYTVTLWNTTNRPLEEMTVFTPNNSTMFENVGAGEFTLVVEPKDVSIHKLPGSCVCKTKNGDCRNLCARSHRKFTQRACEASTTAPPIGPPGRQVATTTEDPLTSAFPIGVTIAAFTGSVCSLAFIIAATVCLIRKNKCKFISMKMSRYDENVRLDQDGLQFLGRKELTSSCASRQRTVLVLFSHEHPRHTTVVLNFARVLKEMFNFDITVDMWSTQDIAAIGKIEWLTKNIERAHSIIVVCSEDANRVSRAQQEKKSFSRPIPCQHDPYGDIFTLALSMIRRRGLKDEIYKKTVCTRFHYTPEFSLLDGCHTFCLLNDLKGVLEFIQSGSQKIECALSEASPETVRAWQRLNESIEEADRYFRGNTKWWSDVFGLRMSQCPEHDPEMAEESYDSGIVCNGDIGRIVRLQSCGKSGTHMQVFPSENNGFTASTLQQHTQLLANGCRFPVLKPPRDVDNLSKTFSQTAREINADCEGDFDMSGDEISDMQEPWLTKEIEDNFSLQSGEQISL